jgi:ATP-dependent Clp protease ATP-binding subunit ClpA
MPKVLAIGSDQQFIEPQHLLLALINQDEGGTSSLLARAGVNVPGLRKDLEAAIKRLPQVSGHGGDVSVGRDLGNLFNLTDKEAQKRGDQFIASEMFLLALCEDKNETARIAKQHGLSRKLFGDRNHGGTWRAGRRFAGCRRPARSLEEILYRPDRTRRAAASWTR